RNLAVKSACPSRLFRRWATLPCARTPRTTLSPFGKGTRAQNRWLAAENRQTRIETGEIYEQNPSIGRHEEEGIHPDGRWRAPELGNQRAALRGRGDRK